MALEMVEWRELNLDSQKVVGRAPKMESLTADYLTNLKDKQSAPVRVVCSEQTMAARTVW